MMPTSVDWTHRGPKPVEYLTLTGSTVLGLWSVNGERLGQSIEKYNEAWGDEPRESPQRRAEQATFEDGDEPDDNNQ